MNTKANALNGAAKPKAVKVNAEAEYRAIANIENDRESRVIEQYGHAIAGKVALEAQGLAWATGGRDAAKGFLEAAGVNYDQVKRVLSRSVALTTEGRKGYVEGLAEAAKGGFAPTMAALAKAGIKSQYDVIERTKQDSDGPDTNNPAKRLAALLKKLADERNGYAAIAGVLHQVGSEVEGFAEKLNAAIDAHAAKLARKAVGTRGKAKAKASLNGATA